VRTVALDPASLTSVHLLQVLLREYHGLHPKSLDLSAFPRDADAALIIGNQAIDFRQNDQEGYRILDLGEEWKRCTGLPFVYAPWLLRPDLANAAEVAGELRALKARGLAYLDEIINAEPRDPTFTRDYLTRHIRFELGDAEKAGIEKYRELLVKHGLIAQDPTPLRYV
jgi:chorismate dehydratase